MKWLTDLSAHRPWLVLLLLLAATVGTSYGLTRIEIDSDVLRDLPDSMPAKVLYDRIGEMFPSKEMVFIGVESPDLWTPEGLRQLDTLTRAIEDVSIVQQVLSPTNASVVEGTAEGMIIRDAVEDFPETTEEAVAFRDFLLGQDALRGQVISDDGAVASIVVYLSTNLVVPDPDDPDQVITLTESKAAGLVDDAVMASKGDLVVYPAGRPMVSYYSSKTIGMETGMLSMAALVLMTILLLALFRNFRGVVLPLVVVIGAVLWTMGLMGWSGTAMTHSTEALPIMLIAIGVADGVHIVQAYMARAAIAKDKLAAVIHTMDDLRPPVIMTSITTAVGFLALNTSGVRSIMILGILVALGTTVALLFSLTAIPAILVLLPLPRRARTAEVREKGYRLQRIMGAFSDWLVDHKLAVGGILGAMVLAAIFGATRVESETSVLENMKEDHPVRVATVFVNDHFSGVTNLQVVFEGEGANATHDPALMRQIQAFEDYVVTIDGVGKTVSVVPLLTSMNEVLHAGDAAYDRLPDDVEVERGVEYRWDEEAGEELEIPVVRQVTGRQVLDGYFALFEMQGRGRDLSNFLSEDHSAAKVSVFLESDRKKDMDRIVTEIRSYMDDNLEGATVEMTGMAVLMLAVNDLITVGQSWSIVVSLILVFLLTTALFRSPALGLCNVVPLFAAIFFNFGVMGLFGMDLNLMTMGVASMAIGVGVDFAIHFVHRYRTAFAEAGEPRQALRLTFEEAGVAILMNMVAVAGGFLTLLLASFKGVMQMGLLISLIMAFSALGALTILPVIFSGLRPKAAESLNKAAPAALVLLLLGGAMLPAVSTAAEGDGRAYMESVLDKNAFASMAGWTTLTLTNAKGAEKVREFKMVSRDNDVGETDLIMRMEEPADMRGNGFLVKGREGDDDRYIYVPALGRSSRIVGSGRGGSFMSSEFSYEDIGSPELDEWVWTLAGEAEVDGHACVVVEATPATDKIEKDTGYTKVRYYVDSQLLVSRKAEFWDKAGVLFKVLDVLEIQNLGDGVPFGTDMRMTDVASGRTSRMVMRDLVIDSPAVDARLFSNRSLQSGFSLPGEE